MKRTSRGVFDSETLQNIGKRIRVARGDATQEEFSTKIGVGRTVLANYEAGRRLPDSKTLEAMARHSGQSVAYILTGVEAERDPFTVDTVYDGTPYDYGYAAALFLYDHMRGSFADKSATDRLILWGDILPKLAEHLEFVIGDNVSTNDSEYVIELERLIEEFRTAEMSSLLELIIKVQTGK